MSTRGALASASDNIPDIWRVVAGPLARLPGAPVLVLGGRARSIGMYAAARALALGAERVGYLDTSTERLDIATTLGARPIDRPGWRNRSTWTARRAGYPVVVDASAARWATCCAHSLRAASAPR